MDGQYYMIDALEMPSKHLSSDPLLISAIQMTDVCSQPPPSRISHPSSSSGARMCPGSPRLTVPSHASSSLTLCRPQGAIIVYDVTSPSSLRLAQGIQELIRDTVGGSGPSPAPAMATAASSPITTTHIHSARQRQQTRNQQDIGTTMLLSPTSATTNASTGTRDTRGTLSSGADSGSVASSTTGTTASDSSAPGSPLYIATTNPQPTTPGTLAAAATTPRHQPQQRDYGVILVGNKSDVDLLPPHSQQQRAVSWSEGSRAATAFLPGLRASFVEVSARTGEGVDPLFEAVAREILRLRRASQQRREREAAVRRMEEEQAAKIAANSPPVTGTRDTKKRGLWRRISRPFFRREVA